MKYKKGDFNFVWLFAILAGIAILLLLIYVAVRSGSLIEKSQNTELSAQLSSLTDPLQANFASAKKSVIDFKQEVSIDVDCDSYLFGDNGLRVSVLKNKRSEISLSQVSVKTTNKYFFVPNISSKIFYTLSVPIDIAFKVSDSLILVPQEYCFLGLEDRTDISYIKNTLNLLGDRAKFGVFNCSEDSIKVCFGSTGGCDIQVMPSCDDSYRCRDPFETGTVEKDGERINYIGDFLYPAIFSSKELYECNLKRILYRQGVLSDLYIGKIDSFVSRGCTSSLSMDLTNLKEKSFSLNQNINSRELEELYFLGKYIRNTEGKEECGLWSKN